MHELLTDLKLMMGMTQTQTDADSGLDMALYAAEGRLKKQYGIVARMSDITITFNGSAKNKYYFQVVPVNYISELRIDGSVVDTTTVKNDDATLVLTAGTFTAGIYNCEVDINVGYDVEDLPSDLKYAILKVAERNYMDSAKNKSGARMSTNPQGERTEFKPIDFHPAVEQIIMSYRTIIV